jgi:hypothetical protein
MAECVQLRRGTDSMTKNGEMKGSCCGFLKDIRQ